MQPRSSKKVITRRDFLKTGGYAAAGGLLGLPLLERAAGQAAAKSRVVLIRDPDAVDSRGRVNETVLESMLDQAVTTLLGAQNPQSAWQQLFRPGDVVGIKSNVWYRLPTPEALEKALVFRLQQAGVNSNDIAVDDRGIRDNPVFKRSTALINVRPMRTHHWSGLGTLLKNYIMFAPAPWMYHGNGCERLGAIWQKYQVAGKTRLNILVMLTPLFHGIGPHHYSSRYVWPYAGLIVSTDPVAADATGARIIEAKRDAFFGGSRPISPPPGHIAAADTRFGLGCSSPERIELIRVGWEDQILI
jgi:hypothetical protein